MHPPNQNSNRSLVGGPSYVQRWMVPLILNVHFHQAIYIYKSCMPSVTTAVTQGNMSNSNLINNLFINVKKFLIKFSIQGLY